MTTPSLHTALQREREALRTLLETLRPSVPESECMAACEVFQSAQRATDQALAALETRPTLAEVEKAIGGLPLYPGLLLARKDVIAVLNELYRRGGA